jgi:hypothetical protein
MSAKTGEINDTPVKIVQNGRLRRCGAGEGAYSPIY